MEAARRLALGDDVLARRHLDDVGMLADPGQLLVAEVGEKEQVAQFHRRTHCSARYRCTSVTAIAPSPTADATRLTDSARTSPATNTPGTLDSRW